MTGITTGSAGGNEVLILPILVTVEDVILLKYSSIKFAITNFKVLNYLIKLGLLKLRHLYQKRRPRSSTGKSFRGSRVKTCVADVGP